MFNSHNLLREENRELSIMQNCCVFLIRFVSDSLLLCLA